MKSRGVLFAAGFILGLLVGLVLAQEEIRSQIKMAAIQLGSRVDQQLQRLIKKTTRSDESSEPANTGQNQEISPAKPPPPEKPTYIREHLQLSSVQAKIDPESGKGAVITGRVQNSGEWILKSVSVTAYFMSESEIVFDRSIPIVTETLLLAGAEEEFKVSVLNIPGTWSGGRVRAAITDIEFAD